MRGMCFDPQDLAGFGWTNWTNWTDWTNHCSKLRDISRELHRPFQRLFSRVTDVTVYSSRYSPSLVNSPVNFQTGIKLGISKLPSFPISRLRLSQLPQSLQQGGKDHFPDFPAAWASYRIPLPCHERHIWECCRVGSKGLNMLIQGPVFNPAVWQTFDGLFLC